MKRPYVQKYTHGICHCCLGKSYAEIIYTSYGAKIILCYKCLTAIVSQVPTKGSVNYEQEE